MDIERNLDLATADIKDVIDHQKIQLEDGDPVQRIDAPKATLADFRAYFGKLKNFKVLFGTAYSWFALDVSCNRRFLSPFIHFHL